MKQILFIVNQKSGTDSKKELPDQIRRILNPDKFSPKIVYTGYKDHAIALAAQAAQKGIDIVAAVGGDGTVAEVAKGILNSNILLAIIPRGSGNGLARSLNIPLNTNDAISTINKLNYKPIDIGFANEHLFLNNAGVGFDATVARLFSQESRGRGLKNYARIIIKALRSYQSKHYYLSIDGKEIREQAFFITAANGNQLGYNFKIASGAKTDDGLLDICIMKPLKIWQLPAATLLAFSGRLTNSRFTNHFRARTITITCYEPMEWMQTDGDPLPLKNQKVQIRIQQKAIKVVVP